MNRLPTAVAITLGLFTTSASAIGAQSRLATVRDSRLIVEQGATLDAIRASFEDPARQPKSAEVVEVAQKQQGGWGGLLQNLFNGDDDQGGNNNWNDDHQDHHHHYNNNQQNSKRGWGNKYDDDDQYWPSQQYQPAPQAPAAPATPPAPPKPKPDSQGPFTILDYTPNRLPPTPTRVPAQLRKDVIRELDKVVVDTVETIEVVLRAADISDITTKRVLIKAQHTAGSGQDSDMITELRRAVISKDALKVDEIGLTLSMSEDDLERVVLATFIAELTMAVEEAGSPDVDHDRASDSVQRSVRRFQKKLRKSSVLEKDLRDGLAERLETILAILDARDELQRTPDPSKDAAADELSWPVGEIWVLAIPEIKPGSVFLITSKLVIAGTTVAGPISIMKSTVSSAFGCRGFDEPTADQQRIPAVSTKTRITFVNPPGSGKDFAFQLNGYDYTLKPSTMYWFTNSDDRKLESCRYSSDGGQMNQIFGFKEQDGTTINEACFVAVWDGTTWRCARKNTVPYVSMTANPLTPPEAYIFNETDRTLKFTFNRTAQTLLAGTGLSVDHVSDWTIRFATTKPATKDQPKAGERQYTIGAGKSFRLTLDDEGLDLKQRPADTLTIDNKENAVAFSYQLGQEWHSVDPHARGSHTFPTPPALTITYDEGDGTLITAPISPSGEYFVGLSPALRFVLGHDIAAAKPTLDSQRQAYLKREGELLARAEQLEDERRSRPADDEVAHQESKQQPAEEETSSTKPKRQSGRHLPTAHLLSIGISKYHDSKLNLKYSDHDATEFVETFKQSAGDLFADVSDELLVNEEATKLGVDKALSELTKNVEAGDLAVLFFSAHGRADGDRYYLCPHDFNPDDLVSTSVKYSDIVDTVRTLGRKECPVLILADTCYSAALSAAMGAKSTGSGTLRDAHKAAIHDTGKDRGSCMLLASSSEDQESYERDEWQHGAFTKALLDVIKDPLTDEDDNGLLFASEIADALRLQMRRLTNKKQQSFCDWPNNDKDFALLKSAH